MDYKLIAGIQQFGQEQVAVVAFRVGVVEGAGLVRPIPQPELGVAVAALERIINREAAVVREEIEKKAQAQKASAEPELEPPGNNRIIEP